MEDDDYLIICRICGENLHSPKYRYCLDCKEDMTTTCECCGQEFVNPDNHPTCWNCAKEDLRQCDCGNWHHRKYKKCYSCAQKEWNQQSGVAVETTPTDEEPDF